VYLSKEMKPVLPRRNERERRKKGRKEKKRKERRRVV
jgi:hypothetical protein